MAKVYFAKFILPASIFLLRVCAIAKVEGCVRRLNKEDKIVLSHNFINLLLQFFSALSLEMQKSLLIKIRDPKISFGYCSFMMSLINFFSYMCPRFRQNLFYHLVMEQIPTMLEVSTCQIKSVQSGY